ncbi:hypothetical protein L596_022291 [Steinernema carpocapsae]|uniref:RING-type domain-containing protein n=1 Tax=Steinernema carpocapsae TaxID=34508 RepID=A0A4V6A060_STECR|nr:hypothetical protein L596_022291 [Steinernema carpocapsae]
MPSHPRRTRNIRGSSQPIAQNRTRQPRQTRRSARIANQRGASAAPPDQPEVNRFLELMNGHINNVYNAIHNSPQRLYATLREDEDLLYEDHRRQRQISEAPRNNVEPESMTMRTGRDASDFFAPPPAQPRVDALSSASDDSAVTAHPAVIPAAVEAVRQATERSQSRNAANLFNNITGISMGSLTESLLRARDLAADPLTLEAVRSAGSRNMRAQAEELSTHIEEITDTINRIRSNPFATAFLEQSYPVPGAQVPDDAASMLARFGIQEEVPAQVPASAAGEANEVTPTSLIHRRRTFPTPGSIGGVARTVPVDMIHERSEATNRRLAELRGSVNDRQSTQGRVVITSDPPFAFEPLPREPEVYASHTDFQRRMHQEAESRRLAQEAEHRAQQIYQDEERAREGATGDPDDHGVPCPICFQAFDIPKLLPCCGQSICRKCEHRWTTTQYNTHCPICQTANAVRYGTALGVNHTFQKALAYLNQQARSKIKCEECSTLTDITEIFACETCLQDKPKRMCARCGFKNHKSHEILPFEFADKQRRKRAAEFLADSVANDSAQFKTKVMNLQMKLDANTAAGVKEISKKIREGVGMTQEEVEELQNSAETHLRQSSRILRVMGFMDTVLKMPDDEYAATFPTLVINPMTIPKAEPEEPLEPIVID